MKILVGMVAILSLWGCGPEQSAADRDQQQIDAQYNENKGQLAPFAGTYTGKVEISNGGSLDVSLTLTEADDQAPNPSTLKSVRVPTLKGSLNKCLDSGCFPITATSSKNIDYSTQITDASYDQSTNKITLITTQNVANCSGANVSFCSNFTIVLQWKPGGRNELVGLINNADNSNTNIDVQR